MIDKTNNWSTSKRVLFRWFFTYFFSFALVNIPFTAILVMRLVKPAVQWMAKTVFNENLVIDSRGASGDSLFEYYVILFLLLFSGIVTLVWTLLEKNKKNLNLQVSWLITFLRYYLWLNMVVYGFAKVFELQFPSPSLTRLLDIYGETEPMTLLWTFMGLSSSYQIFTGIAEVIAGAFFLHRKTQTLGALMTFTIMVNVVIMNFSFDVAVKIFATHLMLFSVGILFFDRKRLFRAFFQNDSIPFRNRSITLGNWERLKIKSIIKYSVIVLIYLIAIISMHIQKTNFRNEIKNTPLYGIYEVEYFEQNGNERLPLTSDSLRWDRMVIDYNINKKRIAWIEKMNHNRKEYYYEADTTMQRLRYFSRIDSVLKYDLKYSIPADDKMIITGIDTENGDSLKVHFNIRNKEKFPLLQRKFRWVIEKENKSDK